MSEEELERLKAVIYADYMMATPKAWQAGRPDEVEGLCDSIGSLTAAVVFMAMVGLALLVVMAISLAVR